MSKLTDTCSLVDIRKVSVDMALPKRERIAEFISQIKDPTRYKCGDFIITASFSESGLALEDCLSGLFR